MLKSCLTGDFGLARPYGTLGQQYTPTACTRWYRPPELLLSCRQYGIGADMWSAACVIAEMFRRQPLFQAESDCGQVNAIVDKLGSPDPTLYDRLQVNDPWDFQSATATPMAELLPNAGEDALEILSALLDYDPARRPSACAVLQHKYLASEPADESEEGKKAQARRAADIERLRCTAPSARPVNGNLNGAGEQYAAWRMAQRAIEHLDGDQDSSFLGIEGLGLPHAGIPMARTGLSGFDTADIPSASKRMALDLSAVAVSASSGSTGAGCRTVCAGRLWGGDVSGVEGVPGGEKLGGVAGGVRGMGRNNQITGSTPSGIGGDGFEPILQDSLDQSGSCASLRCTPAPGCLSGGSCSYFGARPDAMDITPAPKIAINFSTPDHSAAGGPGGAGPPSEGTTSSGSAQLNGTSDSDISLNSASACLNGLPPTPGLRQKLGIGPCSHL